MKMKAAFTLLELLIAITIFSGLVIIAVGVFARTITSSARSNVSRARTEAARAVVDQINNDFRYVVENTVPANCATAQAVLDGAGNNQSWRGYCVDTSGSNPILYMLIKYPGDSNYTAKAYALTTDNGINMSQAVCPDKTCSTTAVLTGSNILDTTRYKLDNNIPFVAVPDTIIPIGKGLFNEGAVVTKGSLTLTLNIKPFDDASSCTGTTNADPSLCYELSSTLVPGGFQ